MLFRIVRGDSLRIPRKHPAPPDRMEVYRNPHQPTPGLILRDFGLLLLRIAVAFSLLAWHGWDLSLGAWKHVWNKQAWEFADTLQAHGFPAPSVVGTVIAVLLVFCSLFLFFGLLTRISAAIILSGMLVTGFLYTDYSAVIELATLYSAILLVLCISGAGRFSMDALLSGRKRQRRG